MFPSSGGIFDIDDAEARLEDLDRQTSMPEFWDDNTRAQKLLRDKGGLERTVRDFVALESLSEEIEALIELAEEAQDDELAQEARQSLARIERELKSIETTRLLSWPNDELNAIVEINAGAGGTDAADWAQILTRMYSRWAEERGFSVEVLDQQIAEEAGVRSATLAIRGGFAYGYLQSEIGVHRLVRISPFDQASRRHTSFAAVTAYAEIDDSIEVDLNPADIEMETMRASGAGGQHVNTTDSAVRLRHKPTGFVVKCSQERSQHKNRDTAMKMLKAKIYQFELDKRQEAQDAINAKKRRIDFGSQIRSYVMQPYQLVKDLRTGQTAGDVDRVLDGDINGFMESWLAARADGTLADV